MEETEASLRVLIARMDYLERKFDRRTLQKGRRSSRSSRSPEESVEVEGIKSHVNEVLSIEKDVVYVSYEEWSAARWHHWDDRSLVVVMEANIPITNQHSHRLLASDSQAKSVPSKQLSNIEEQRNACMPSIVDAENHTPAAVPTRIRITNKVLFSEINKIIGSVQDHDQARPFRSLLRFDQKFRERLLEQEKSYERVLADYLILPAGGNDGSRSVPAERVHDDSAEAQEPIEETIPDKDPKRALVLREQKLLNGLQCLVHFLDTNCRDLLDIRERIDKGALQEIAFEHLRFLFRVGEQIISTKPKEQAYRVLQVCGGRRILDRVPDHEQPRGGRAKISDFVIDGFYIDFDGKLFRAAPKSIFIAPYEGLRAITSLETFPLRFHKSEEQAEERLIARGMKFSKLVKDMHKKYKGLSIKEGGDVYSRHEEVSVYGVVSLTAPLTYVRW